MRQGSERGADWQGGALYKRYRCVGGDDGGAATVKQACVFIALGKLPIFFRLDSSWSAM